MSHKSKSTYVSQNVNRRKAHYRVHITCIKKIGAGGGRITLALSKKKDPSLCLVINKSPSGLSTEIVLVANKSSWHVETAQLAGEGQQTGIKCQRQQSLGFAIHLYLRKRKKKEANCN